MVDEVSKGDKGGRLPLCHLPVRGQLYRVTRAGLLGSQGTPQGVLRLLAGETHLDSRGGQTDSWPRYTADHSAGEWPGAPESGCISERRLDGRSRAAGVGVC